ncbi:tyrosine-type recombinase/integrase [Rubellimicrobium arenae]|uniref:tyrosine-type recombinase/integrase n=1 Tax=Rubellimicrobium arenae TaxID=2817372 RepID=UPI001B315707|nr:tyrosine-type recombinase/integrase [Rubellimicrobium arenae]
MADTTGIHRVSKTLTDGTVRQYHYAFRGGPLFWKTGDKIPVDSPAYEASRQKKIAEHRRSKSLPQLSLSSPEERTTKIIMDRYRASPAYVLRAQRTKDDYDEFLDSFVKEFGPDPIKIFEDPESVSHINDWKQAWAHAPRRYDYATTVVTRFLNWAKATDKAINTHHHWKQERYYNCDRSHIIWLPQEREALLTGASEREYRIAVAALNALTPQDIGLIKPEHVHPTPKGRRFLWRRTKTGKPFSIPLTPDLDRVVDETPPDQEYLFVALDGGQLSPERAAQIVRAMKMRANFRQPNSIRQELRLYDMRGTAATRLFRAGCSLKQIATYMGWGIRHASNVIEKYVCLVPEEADDILEKLALALSREIE